MEFKTSGSCIGEFIVIKENLLDAISNGSYAIGGPDKMVKQLAKSNY